MTKRPVVFRSGVAGQVMQASGSGQAGEGQQQHRGRELQPAARTAILYFVQQLSGESTAIEWTAKKRPG